MLFHLLSLRRGRAAASGCGSRHPCSVCRRLPVRAALLFLLIPASASGFQARDESPGVHPGRPRFVADAGTHLGEDGPEVVIMLEVPYAELFFRPAGAHFRSAFDIIFVLNRDGMQVGGELWNEEVLVAEHAHTGDRTTVVRRTCVIPASAGLHKVEAILSESAAGRESRLEWRLTVPDYDTLPLSISSLWLADRREEGVPLSLPPAGHVLSRRFGEPMVRKDVVGEVYRGSPEGGPARIAWRITDSRGDTHQQGEHAVPPGRRALFAISPDFTQLWLGSYVFDLRVAADGRDVRRRFDFQIEATAGAFDADLERSLELIALIADQQEVDQLRNLPAGERKEAWNRFWRGRDPDPDTPENEFRDTFFDRVRYANENFSILEPGWRSDRGRIYIRYGPPDEVESRPHRMDGPPYEIWIYAAPGLRFVFVDYEGFGRYQLYGPGRAGQ